MNPHSVHRIYQRIRNTRNELNAEEKWARTVEHRDTRAIMLEQIFFWRKVMDYAAKLGQETPEQAYNTSDKPQSVSR